MVSAAVEREGGDQQQTQSSGSHTTERTVRKAKSDTCPESPPTKRARKDPGEEELEEGEIKSEDEEEVEEHNERFDVTRDEQLDSLDTETEGDAGAVREPAEVVMTQEEAFEEGGIAGKDGEEVEENNNSCHVTRDEHLDSLDTETEGEAVREPAKEEEGMEKKDGEEVEEHNERCDVTGDEQVDGLDTETEGDAGAVREPAEVVMAQEGAVEELEPGSARHCHEQNESAHAADSSGLE